MASGPTLPNKPTPAGRARRLGEADVEAAAAMHLRSWNAAFPWLAGMHTAEDTIGFYREVLLAETDLWGWESDGAILGIMALKSGWIDQLYLAPEAQRQGIGSALVAHAKEGQSTLQLWTFERNHRARAFYEAHGFVAVERTDGSRNEEGEPDIRYRWVRG